MSYEKISDRIAECIKGDRLSGEPGKLAFRDADAVRRLPDTGRPAWMTPFAADIDSILYCPYYNRYTDKTQVFSLLRNDDITRRSLHVQIVSRIARTLGEALGLNIDLIEAISLGHDIGHTPFARNGEKYLDGLLYSHSGRHFNHNAQSVRVFDKIFPYNMTLQTLNGIAAHSGSGDVRVFEPVSLSGFGEFYAMLEESDKRGKDAPGIPPATLEACCVRIADIISYLGKDRQDAVYAGVLGPQVFDEGKFGIVNGEIINNLIVNIIENSYGKPYICMDDAHWELLQKSKHENHALIYEDISSASHLLQTVKPMMEDIYERLLSDLTQRNTASPVFTQHIQYIGATFPEWEDVYAATDPNVIVADFISSMTEDYFVDLHRFLFPDSPLRIKYTGYFDTRFERD